ncbi:hypothetical protein DFH06DRAFT_1152162 [Mycena polygramma]|nr:hypothetical protein DFH06DRAFT_1152162 [Mycena polygramma]
MARSKKSRKKIPKEDRKSLRLWAEGAREAVLTPHIPTYADALDQGHRRIERDVLQSICNEFHARISWRLGDHEEPDQPLAEYDATKITQSETLSEEDEVAKRARISLLNKRIRRWLKYRVRRLRKQYQRKLDPTKDPWAVFLAKLSGINNPPKARQAYQEFMHEAYEEKVAPVVAERWATSVSSGSNVQTSKGPDGPFRAKIAREVFGDLSAAERESYGARAKAAAAEARALYEKLMNDPPSTRPEDRQKCIDSVGTFLGPVLQGIHERTGMHSTVILGGPVPKFAGDLRAIFVSYGRNKTANPAHFPAWVCLRHLMCRISTYHGKRAAAEDIDQSRLPDALLGAKYTISPNGDSDDEDTGSDSDSSSDSDSDSSADESDSNDDSSDSDSPKARKRAKAEKRAEKKAAKKAKKARRKEKKAEKGKDDARAGEKKKTGKERNAGGAGESASSKKTRKSAKSMPSADDQPTAATSSQKRKRNDDDAVDAPAHPARKSRRVQGGEAAMNVDSEPTPTPLSQSQTAPPPPSQSQTTPPPSQAAPPSSSQSQAAPPSSSQSQRTPTPPPTIPVEFPPNAPDWLVNSLTWLMKDDLGCHYRAMVVALVALETKYGFGDPSNNGTLSAKKRPTQVALWIQGGRGTRLKFPPSIGNVEKYAKEWAEWWGMLQPRWREKDERGEWKLEGHETAGADWDPLEAPGQNGCLSLVASLYFWGVCKNQSEELRQRWERAVLDVTWMLEGLRASIA